MGSDERERATEQQLHHAGREDEQPMYRRMFAWLAQTGPSREPSPINRDDFR
jgi:hypothetical protein